MSFELAHREPRDGAEIEDDDEREDRFDMLEDEIDEIFVLLVLQIGV
jgi:hypothetical protein